MLLNFVDQTRTGAFSMIWPLIRNGNEFLSYHSASITFDSNLSGVGLVALAKGRALVMFYLPRLKDINTLIFKKENLDFG